MRKPLVIARHDYPGYRHVGMLPSIAAQRDIERDVLAQLRGGAPIRSLLAVGCGSGEELQHITASLDLGQGLAITAIDVAPVGDSISRLPLANTPGVCLSFRQMDLLELSSLPRYGAFDVVQCGFVLHDIEWQYKGRAISLLAGAPRLGGAVLISEMFLGSLPADRNGVLYRRSVEALYAGFIAETRRAFEQGTIGTTERDALLGDLSTPGLRDIQREAMAGERDFFEDRQHTIGRAVHAGLADVRIVDNPINPRLGVVIARRHSLEKLLST